MHQVPSKEMFLDGGSLLFPLGIKHSVLKAFFCSVLPIIQQQQDQENPVRSTDCWLRIPVVFMTTRWQILMHRTKISKIDSTAQNG